MFLGGQEAVAELEAFRAEENSRQADVDAAVADAEAAEEFARTNPGIHPRQSVHPYIAAATAGANVKRQRQQPAETAEALRAAALRHRKDPAPRQVHIGGNIVRLCPRPSSASIYNIVDVLRGSRLEPTTPEPTPAERKSIAEIIGHAMPTPDFWKTQNVSLIELLQLDIGLLLQSMYKDCTGPASERLLRWAIIKANMCDEEPPVVYPTTRSGRNRIRWTQYDQLLVIAPFQRIGDAKTNPWGVVAAACVKAKELVEEWVRFNASDGVAATLGNVYDLSDAMYRVDGEWFALVAWFLATTLEPFEAMKDARQRIFEEGVDVKERLALSLWRRTAGCELQQYPIQPPQTWQDRLITGRTPPPEPLLFQRILVTVDAIPEGETGATFNRILGFVYVTANDAVVANETRPVHVNLVLNSEVVRSTAPGSSYALTRTRFPREAKYIGISAIKTYIDNVVDAHAAAVQRKSVDCNAWWARMVAEKILPGETAKERLANMLEAVVWRARQQRTGSTLTPWLLPSSGRPTAAADADDVDASSKCLEISLVSDDFQAISSASDNTFTAASAHDTIGPTNFTLLALSTAYVELWGSVLALRFRNPEFGINLVGLPSAWFVNMLGCTFLDERLPLPSYTDSLLQTIGAQALRGTLTLYEWAATRDTSIRGAFVLQQQRGRISASHQLTEEAFRRRWMNLTSVARDLWSSATNLEISNTFVRAYGANGLAESGYLPDSSAGSGASWAGAVRGAVESAADWLIGRNERVPAATVPPFVDSLQAAAVTEAETRIVPFLDSRLQAPVAVVPQTQAGEVVEGLDDAARHDQDILQNPGTPGAPALLEDAVAATDAAVQAADAAERDATPAQRARISELEDALQHLRAQLRERETSDSDAVAMAQSAADSRIAESERAHRESSEQQIQLANERAAAAERQLATAQATYTSQQQAIQAAMDKGVEAENTVNTFSNQMAAVTARSAALEAAALQTQADLAALRHVLGEGNIPELARDLAEHHAQTSAALDALRTETATQRTQNGELALAVAAAQTAAEAARAEADASASASAAATAALQSTLDEARRNVQDLQTAARRGDSDAERALAEEQARAAGLSTQIGRIQSDLASREGQLTSLQQQLQHAEQDAVRHRGSAEQHQSELARAGNTERQLRDEIAGAENRAGAAEASAVRAAADLAAINLRHTEATAELERSRAAHGVSQEEAAASGRDAAAATAALSELRATHLRTQAALEALQQDHDQQGGQNLRLAQAAADAGAAAVALREEVAANGRAAAELRSHLAEARNAQAAAHAAGGSEAGAAAAAAANALAALRVREQAMLAELAQARADLAESAAEIRNLQHNLAAALQQEQLHRNETGAARADAAAAHAGAAAPRSVAAVGAGAAGRAVGHVRPAVLGARAPAARAPAAPVPGAPAPVPGAPAPVLRSRMPDPTYAPQFRELEFGADLF